MVYVLIFAFLVTLISLGFAVLCARLAKSRGIDHPILWGIVGFFFNVLALAVLLILPQRKELSNG